MRGTVIFLGAVALAMSACSDGEKKGQPDRGLSNEEVAAKASAAPKMRPGQYETKTTLIDFDIPGLPASQAESMKSMMSGQFAQAHSYCLTGEEADEGPREMVRHLSQSECKVIRLDTSANSISGEMQCPGADGSSGTVKIDGTYAGDSSNMVMEMTQQMPGMANRAMHMKMRVESHRVGECTG